MAVMGIRQVMAVSITVFIVISLASALQAASCTQANPDWVYVTTITGTKSQDIDIDQLIPTGYHWGVRGAYTSVRDASFELIYNRQSSISGDDSDGDKSVTWKHNFEPSRQNTSYGHGPLKVVASPNILNYTLNIYYDANLGNQTLSITPSPSPTVPEFEPAVILVLVVAVTISLLYFKEQKRKSMQMQPQLPKEAVAKIKFVN
jgi:hypothetical protein